MTTADEQGYNGWANRETWALNLWLTNDEGLYNLTRERVAGARADAEDPDDADSAYWVGGIVRGVWDELTDPDEQMMDVAAILAMVSDIGSVYRVDWDEIGAAWLESAREDES